MSRIYTRADLTSTEEEPCGFVVQVCRLCDSRSLADGDLITHDESCPFAWSAVFAIRGVALTAPRAEICGQCAGSCVVPDWRARR